MSEPSTDAIARELEALGEAPLSAAELAMLAEDALDDEPAVAGTARLIDLAQPYEHQPLGELGIQRVWRRVEPHGRARVRRVQSRWVAVTIAIAAALVLVVVVADREPGDREPGSGSGPSATEVAELGEQARVALHALDEGLDDTARAERARADYLARMEAKP